MELVSGRVADDILERIFTPSTKPSALDQAEETLRHPKRLIYAALSNRNYYWRHHIQKFILDSGMVPVSPFMLFDYYLLHTVPKSVVREAMNNLLARCDECWVFGRISLGVASPRDLISLKSSADQVPTVKRHLAEARSSLVRSPVLGLDDSCRPALHD